MTLKTKLYAAFAATIAATILVAVVGIAGLRSLGNDVTRIEGHWLPSVTAAYEIRGTLFDHRRHELTHLMLRDPAMLERREEQRRAARERFEKQMADYQALISGDEERRAWEQLRALKQTYFADTDRLIPLSTAGKKDEAFAILTGSQLKTFADAIAASSQLVEINRRGASATAAAAHATYDRSFSIIVTVSLVLAAGAVALSFLIIRSVQRQLGADPAEVKAVAERVGAGDLDKPIVLARDDRDSVLAAMAAMQERIQSIVKAQGAMATAHEKGEIDYRIAADQLPGAWGVLARNVNGLVESQLAVQSKLLEVVKHYAKGDFSHDMPQLPGKKAEITRAVQEVKAALSGVSREIDALVVAAGRGEFATRGEPHRYSAKFREMVEGLNRLMGECERGLTDANRMFAALAQGDLTHRIAGEYAGMFAEMKDNANRTAESLSSLVGRIGVASQAIGSATDEIAQGNADLSSRTEEQASSLEETASSMEELTSTVKQNAESAKQANSLAVNAAEIARAGGETVNLAVGTMQEIAEASKRIQDIITVIDGIAFQTNILALNAAVEAARAGEQGRGFAVVASEVRNLAQRSASAAKEIKELITDSVHRVDQGVSQVSEAGTQMAEIVTAIQRVTDIMGEISSASAEQSSGIEQVNTAVTGMDEMTQQNAALVEEAAAAAESLKEQAQQLVAAVGEFRVASSASATWTLAGSAGEPGSTSSVAASGTAAWDGKSERRGPNRAKNVARLKSAASASPVPTPMKKVAAAGDEWSEF